jgi:hypothetical protein
MAGGLFDFLMGQGGQGGGLLGFGNQPMQINPEMQQQGQGLLSMQGQMPPGMSMPGMPQQGPQQYGGLMGMLGVPNNGFMDSMRGSLDQIADPMGQRQQNAMRNYIALQQLELQRKGLEEKPQIVWQDGPDGSKVPYRVGAMGSGITQMPIQGQPPPNPNAPPVPPGMDPKIFKKEITEAEVKNQQEAVKSAKAAAELKPIIDEALAAYEEAHKVGAIGPAAGSAWLGRPADTAGAMLEQGLGLPNQISTKREAARQRYDRAQAALQARATQAQNAGQGAVSNYERELFSRPIPNLQALDPVEAMNVFKQLKAQTEQTVNAGRIPSLGRAPHVEGVLNRPSIPGGLTAPQPPAGAPAPPAAPQGPAAQPSLQGARRAPDGNYYVDDPARPGKYLRVTR